MRRVAFIYLVLSALPSCGHPDVDRKPTRALRSPGASVPDRRFSLENGSGRHSYSGTLLLWDPAVRPEQVARLLSATRSYNEAYSSYISEFDTAASLKVAPLRVELDSEQARQRELQEASSLRLRAQQAEAGRRWFDSTWLSREQGLALTPALRENADKVLERYCEAKIFDLATSPLLATSRFVERPSPSVLCEGVYSRLGMFDGELCSAGADATPRDYLPCIWRQGLLKTSFAARYSESQRADLASRVDLPEFRALFAGTFGEGCVRGTGAVPVSPGASQDIVNLVKRAPRDATLRCGELELDFGFKNTPPATAPVRDRSTPEFVVQSVEKPARATHDSLRLVARNAGGIATSAEAVVWGEELSARIYSLSGLRHPCSSGEQTVHDVRFLLPLQRPESTLGNGCGSPPSETLPEIFVRDEELAQAEERVATLQDSLRESQRSICLSGEEICKGAASSGAYCAQFRALSAKFDVANEPGVSLALIRAFDLVVTRSPGGGRQFALLLGGEPWAHGCVDGGGGSMTCADAAPEGSIVAKVAEDGGDGRLVVDVPLESGNRFLAPDQSVRAEVLREFPGRTLRLELFPNVLGETLPFYSGRATVLDGQREIFLGVGSYLFDTSFAERKAQVCEAP